MKHYDVIYNVISNHAKKLPNVYKTDEFIF